MSNKAYFHFILSSSDYYQFLKSPKNFIGISNKWIPNIHKIIETCNFNKTMHFYVIPKINEKIYLLKTSTLAKLGNIPYQFFNKLSKRQKRNIFLNVIKNNLQDINNFKLTINNEERTLIEWNQFLHKPKFALMNYCYLHGINKTKKYIQDYMQNIHNTIVTQALLGNSITINGITNNLNRWSKLCNFDSSHLYILLYKYDENFVKNTIKKVLSDSTRKSNKLYIEIKGLYATYIQWAQFMNLSEHIFKQMLHNMGYDYTRKYLIKLITIKFPVRKLITINNESHTLYGWAKRLNRQSNYFYPIYKSYGLEYVINLISNLLKDDQSSSKIIKRTLSDEYPILKIYKRVVAVVNFSCRNKIFSL